MFINNGLVELVTLYRKGFSHSQIVKILYRYVPSEGEGSSSSIHSTAEDHTSS